MSLLESNRVAGLIVAFQYTVSRDVLKPYPFCQFADLRSTLGVQEIVSIMGHRSVELEMIR